MPGALTPALAAMPGGGFDPDDVFTLLQPFLPLASPVAVAVSGGPDSLALALGIAHLGLPALGLIVDHGLRATSAAEARQARAQLAALGMPAEILGWQHDGIDNRLHERARAARYALLIAACRRHGAGDLLLGHHREDQAETILMRLQKDSGPRGLAGMRAVAWRDGVRLLRPLLTVPKAQLAAWCAAAGLTPIDDPANRDPRFARGRMRAHHDLTRDGVTIDGLLALGDAARQLADHLDATARSVFAAATRFDPAGFVTIDRAVFTSAPVATAHHLLTACLHRIGGGYPPPRAATERLRHDIVFNTGGSRTLHGCLIGFGAQIRVMREPAAATQRLPFTGGEAVWDRRWRVIATAPYTDGHVLAALGHPPRDVLDALAPGLRRAVPQGRIRAALPALWRDHTLIAVPSFDPSAPFRLRSILPATLFAA